MLLSHRFFDHHMIYRITDAADWRRAQQSGFFQSADLEAEGFIHCSEKHQVVGTASRYFKGRGDLMVLAIDDAALGATLKREDTTGRGEKFPHVYAAIPLGAIKQVIELAWTSEGFVLVD
jgi:uncharacterized protein (DUF952 family)